MNRLVVSIFVLYFIALGIVMCISVRRSEKIELGMIPTESKRYLPNFGLILMHFAIPFVLMDLLLPGFANRQYLPLIIEISIFYCLLLIGLVPLRKVIKAKTCSWLWMVPFSCVYIYAKMGSGIWEPFLVIPLGKGFSDEIWNVLVKVWLLGAAAVFAYHIVTHLIFKRKLLKNTYEVTDAQILQIWERERYIARFPDNYLKLRISSQAQTPLSVGLFPKSTYVILPEEKAYSLEDLSLIFRHELIHIGRRDSAVKFYMLLITALFWFHPLIWLVMRYSADDAELSCDETVLLGCDRQTRKRYAELLLYTAADHRGFTTCLSASARALRYRMKQAMVDRKRSYGILVLCAVMIFFEMSCLFVDFSYRPGTAAEQIYIEQDPKVYTVEDAFVLDEVYENAQTEALMEYLLEMPVSRLMRHYPRMGLEGNHGQIMVTTQDEKYIIWLSDHYMRVRFFSDEKTTENCYVLQEPVNWEKFISFFES